MRVDWWSNPPWCATGYAVQTAMWVPRIAALGHDVAISAPFSFSGAPLGWRGFKVLPGGQDPFGSDVLVGHYRHHRADLMITLCDVFMMDANALKAVNAACWTPIDCDPLGQGDRAKLWESGATPIAMSEFGLRVLRKAGFDPYYVPHAVETQVFRPPADRDGLRDSLGIGPKTFVVGLNAANKEGPRKRFYEQFAGFARFHARHPDSRLAVHSLIEPRGGKNLRTIATALGIGGAVFFPVQYELLCGMIDQESLAAWYGALDVLANCSNEGFGLCMLEAQACGTPVVTMNASTGPELCGSGWLVSGEDDWVEGHDSHWDKPLIAAIDEAFEKAWQAREDGSIAPMREKAVEFAEGYDADLVFGKYWMPVLAALDERRTKAVDAGMRAKAKPAERQEDMADLLLIVPSRGHPARVRRLLKAMGETCTARTHVVFAFDSCDPALDDCEDAAVDALAMTDVGTRRKVATRVNDIALKYAGRYRAVMFATDVALPATEGWDTAILAALDLSRGGFVYPCDPACPGVPSSMAVSSDVVKALGWLCEPSLDHSYLGNVWIDVGKHAGCITYLPDVTVGQGQDPEDGEDLPYEPVLATAPDEAAYQAWRAERMHADIATVRALREAAS